MEKEDLKGDISFPTFKELYNKLFELRTFDRMMELSDIYINKTDDKIERQLMSSLINKYRFRKKLDPEVFCTYIEVIENLTSYNDALRIYDNIRGKTNDVAQINTLNRVMKNKKIDTNDLRVDQEGTDANCPAKIYKPCPHCDRILMGDDKTKYIICGYSKKGFDWKGCGRDWCFQCGKKLCKCWNIDFLFDTNNRYHNNKCCKYFAHKIGDTYEKDYCQCKEFYVKR